MASGRPACFNGTCEPQPGTQLVGDVKSGALLPSRTASTCNKWMHSGTPPSAENGNQTLLNNVDGSLDGTKPEVSYTMHTNFNYRPCDARKRGEPNATLACSACAVHGN